MADKPDAQPQPNGDQPPAPIHNPAVVAAAPSEAVPPAAEQTPATAPPPEKPEAVAPVTLEPAPAEPVSPPPATAAPDYKSQLCDSLGLPADSTDDQISQALSGQKQAATDAKQKEVDGLMAGYELSDEAKTALRETLLADRAKGQALLGAMPKKAPVAPVPQPPAPVHTPPGQQGAQKEMSAEQKITDQNALIKEIQGAGKFSDYTQAREEARRQKPELFS